MNNYRPVIGITMGDPVGIGPEIILKALSSPLIYKTCKPLVIGDLGVLELAKKSTSSTLKIKDVKTPDSGADGLMFYAYPNLIRIKYPGVNPQFKQELQ